MEFELAPQFSVEQYEDIAQGFFPRILDMDYDDVLITDESSIYDFDSGEEDATKGILRKIEDAYGIDVSDVEDLLLVKIFERIRILSP